MNPSKMYNPNVTEIKRIKNLDYDGNYYAYWEKIQDTHYVFYKLLENGTVYSWSQKYLYQ